MRSGPAAGAGMGPHDQRVGVDLARRAVAAPLFFKPQINGPISGPSLLTRRGAFCVSGLAIQPVARGRIQPVAL